MSLFFLERPFECIRRWLKKSSNVTKQNLPPFSVSGDINDVPFPIPQYIMKSLNVCTQTFPPTQPSSPTLRHIFESNITPRSIEQPFPRLLFNPIPVNKEFVYGVRTRGTELLNSSQNILTGYHHANCKPPQKKKRLPLIPLEVLSTNEKALQKYCKSKVPNKKKPSKAKQKNRKLDIPEEKNLSEATKSLTKKVYERPTREALNGYLQKFAEQMNRNITEFETFCLAAESKPLVRKRRR